MHFGKDARWAVRWPMRLVVEKGEFQALHDHDPLGRSRLEQFVELPRVKRLRRPVVEHVDDVDDHHVVKIFAFGDELAAVVVNHPHADRRRRLDARIQVFAAQFDHLAIEIDHRGRTDRAMHQCLAQRRALAAADDQHVARVRVPEHGWLDQ